jgi:hypothetical protein
MKLPLSLPHSLPLLLLIALVCRAAPVHAQSATVVETTLPRADAGASLRSLAQQAPTLAPAAQRRVVPLRLIPAPAKDRPRLTVTEHGAAPSSALQAGAAAPPMPRVNTGGTLINIEGIASNHTFAPADPNGAVGESQYVQWVNSRLAIYDKASGALLLGPIPGNTVFGGFTGSPGADACRLSNNGDPIAQYDKAAKRWLLTQFAWLPENFGTGPYYQCIAVSTTSDATGSYYRYALETRGPGNTIAFNDYPKVGVWPDAYYFTFALFDPTLSAFLGPQACGLDRASMLAGAATLVRCISFGTQFGVLLPSDLDGPTPPPAGSPNYLMSLNYGGDARGASLLQWRFSFSNASVEGPIEIPVAPFTLACPTTFGGACIQQPTPGEPLDALGDRLMYRVAYRNFGDREALVLNHSVQQPGAPDDGPVAVRWYEVRNPGGTPAVYQQGNHMPDANSRWMGSVAMDRMGNIALGYSVSSATTPPGIRYTGRMRSEPLGRLESEAVIVNGGGVQINTIGRWGDYSAMTVDPVNDCAFWYTQQYIATTGDFNWNTRIADFKFINCK